LRARALLGPGVKTGAFLYPHGSAERETNKHQLYVKNKQTSTAQEKRKTETKKTEQNNGTSKNLPAKK